MDFYLANLSKRYRTANKHEKGLILNELCEMGCFHKKHAIRLLNTQKKKQKPRINIGRPNLYPAKFYLEPLRRIWLSSDQPCGKRLKMALPLWLPHYNEAYEKLDPAIYEDVRSKLSKYKPSETSPRARGRLISKAHFIILRRNTPTCVGKTCLCYCKCL